MKTVGLTSMVVAAGCVLLQAGSVAGPLDNWHLRDSAAEGQPLLSVAFQSGLFVATGDNGTMVTSPDGVTWTRQESGTSASLGVAGGGGVFVAFGSPDVLLRSTDGADWDRVPWGERETQAVGLAYAGERFFLLARASIIGGQTGWAPVIFTSQDGAAWTRQSLLDFDGAALSDVAYGDGRYVAVGEKFQVMDWPEWGEGPFPFVLVSSDALAWQQVDELTWQSWGGGAGFTGVAYGDRVFAALPGAFSTTGANWSRTRGEWPGNHSIAYGGGVFVAVGDLGWMASSFDGIHWSARSPAPEHRAVIDVAYGRNTFVAVASGGIILQSDPIVSLTVNRASLAQLSIAGPPGRTCRIEAADGVAASNGWEPLDEITLADDTTVWTDAASADQPQRYYRAVLLP